jgi:integrase
MSITKLPSGRYRAQVYDPRVGHNVSVSRVLGPPGTFPTKREAKAARERARDRIALAATTSVTVKSWWERWTTDPLFARPKDSTNIHNRERTRAFADRFGSIPLTAVDDSTVSLWLAGGARNSTVPALRAMFNDARSAKGGRLVQTNPFAGLRLDRGRGNRDKQPPSEQHVRAMIQHAHQLTFPAFAAWLQVAAFTGMRPGELDALRWTSVHLDTHRIDVLEQWNARSRAFTLPKNGLTRQAPLTAPARDALLRLPRDGEFVFTNLRGRHLTPGSRAYHWNAVRAAAGWTESLYLATRHFAGWWMVNVLDLPSEDVAIALGHTDGGQLVRQLYGHRDKDRALDRAIHAASAAGTVTPLRLVDEGAAS